MAPKIARMKINCSSDKRENEEAFFLLALRLRGKLIINKLFIDFLVFNKRNRLLSQRQTAIETWKESGQIWYFFSSFEVNFNWVEKEENFYVSLFRFSSSSLLHKLRGKCFPGFELPNFWWMIAESRKVTLDFPPRNENEVDTFFSCYNFYREQIV